MSARKVRYKVVLGGILLLWIGLVSLEIHSIYNTIEDDFNTEDAQQSSTNQNYSSEVTIVTALFDIGSFPKIHNTTWRHPDEYLTWMQVVKTMDNPLVAFTDSLHIYERFVQLRKTFSPDRTKVFLINRSDLWAFRLADEIRRIHHQPNYPVFYPATMNENYSCVMHAKYELLQKVIHQGINTRYISWVDIGIYRGVSKWGIFHVGLPSNFDEGRVSVAQMRPFYDVPPETIINNNMIWIGGGIVMGRSDVILIFVDDYRRSVRALLDHGLIHVDQQVIYCMYSTSFYFRPRIELQTFNRGKDNDWFCLADETRFKGRYRET